MVLACQNIDKAYNDNVILKNINFHIEERERVAVVGANGAGKTTLLRIITGNEEADSGNIIIAKDKELGYLTQNVSYESDLTIYEAMREARKHIFELEKRIRDLEVAMKSKEGDELEALLTDYNRLSSEFELKNGYATESEITGVIKCHNPRCISSIEQELPQIFYLSDEKKEIYRCKYCDEKYSEATNASH